MTWGSLKGPRCEEEEFAVESSEETLLGFTPQDAADQMPLSNTVDQNGKMGPWIVYTTPCN